MLIRVFIGGALQPELVERDDSELTCIALQDLAELLGASGDPELVQVIRWHNAMPQYHLGHLEQPVDRIAARVAQRPGLALAGSGYRGVGIPHCIHSGQQAADQVARARAAIRDCSPVRGDLWLLNGTIGRLVQRLEQCPYKAKVGGSIPSPPTDTGE